MTEMHRRSAALEKRRLNPPPQTFGQRLRWVRQYENLSLEQLADQCDMSKGFLCDIENDKRCPSAERLFRLATVLGVTMDYLYTGEYKR